jgi:hypothetical protein
MPSDEEFEQLKGRISDLENQLAARRERVPVTREEYETYTKVHNALTGRLSPGHVYQFQVCLCACLPMPVPVMIVPLAPGADPVDVGGAEQFGDLGE